MTRAQRYLLAWWIGVPAVLAVWIGVGIAYWIAMHPTHGTWSTWCSDNVFGFEDVQCPRHYDPVSTFDRIAAVVIAVIWPVWVGAALAAACLLLAALGWLLIRVPRVLWWLFTCLPVLIWSGVTWPVRAMHEAWERAGQEMS
jgi:hypothetical protein